MHVTEWDEPQAVIGSYLHRYAYPDALRGAPEARAASCRCAFAHERRPDRLPAAARRVPVLAAEGSSGMRVYDVASIANKGFSRAHPHGAGLAARARACTSRPSDATCVALPTNQPIHPDRNKGDLMRVDNQEQPFHPIYNYAFITDRVEGLIVIDVNTLVDGEPRNNFLERALTWNEGGVLNGARHLTIAGTFFYVAADAGPRRARHGRPADAQAGHGAAARRTCARPRSSSATCSRSTARA